MQKENGEVEEDDDEEWQDEDDGQRREDPQQVLQNTQVVLHLAQTRPLFTRMENAHLWDAESAFSIRNTCPKRKKTSLVFLTYILHVDLDLQL